MEGQLSQHLLTEYPEWHHHPLALSIREMQNPEIVVTAFFDRYNLKDIRFCLKEWLRETVQPGRILEMDFLTLHDDIIKLIEAVSMPYNHPVDDPEKKTDK